MATESYSQFGFGFQPKRVVDFAGGTLTTDAGLLLVREFDEQLGLSADVVSRVTDARDARYVTHDVATLRRQRLYQIAAGYEDVNDADRLRHDPIPSRGRRWTHGARLATHALAAGECGRMARDSPP